MFHRPEALFPEWCGVVWCGYPEESEVVACARELKLKGDPKIALAMNEVSMNNMKRIQQRKEKVLSVKHNLSSTPNVSKCIYL
jgi:hypothetical protein